MFILLAETPQDMVNTTEQTLEDELREHTNNWIDLPTIKEDSITRVQTKYAHGLFLMQELIPGVVRYGLYPEKPNVLNFDQKTGRITLPSMGYDFRWGSDAYALPGGQLYLPLTTDDTTLQNTRLLHDQAEFAMTRREYRDTPHEIVFIPFAVTAQYFPRKMLTHEKYSYVNFEKDGAPWKDTLVQFYAADLQRQFNEADAIIEKMRENSSKAKLILQRCIPQTEPNVTRC
jgi:hypothetical protein